MNQGCFPLCQNDLSENSGTNLGEWNDIFRLNRATEKNSSQHFSSLFRIPCVTETDLLKRRSKALNGSVKIECPANFGSTSVTDQSRALQFRGGPQHSGWTELKRTFPFDFLAWWKHPAIPVQVSKPDMFAISEGPVSRNTQKLFGAVKPLVCSRESKHGGVYTLETSVEGNLCLY